MSISNKNQSEDLQIYLPRHLNKPHPKKNNDWASIKHYYIVFNKTEKVSPIMIIIKAKILMVFY